MELLFKAHIDKFDKQFLSYCIDDKYIILASNLEDAYVQGAGIVLKINVEHKMIIKVSPYFNGFIGNAFEMIDRIKEASYILIEDID